MAAIQEVSRAVADLEHQGIRLSIEAGKLIARPGSRLTPELRRMLATNLDAIAAHVRRQSKARPPGADSTPRAADPGPHGYGCCFRCGSDLPDGVEIAECRGCRAPRGAAPVASDRQGGPWIVARDGDGDMRLVVASAPPWPDAVFAAAALVELIDHHHGAGRDALAQAAAERLEAKLVALRAEGIEAWLAS